MRSLPLLLCSLLLLPAVPLIGSGPAQADGEYQTRVINSFETGVEESTEYGTWANYTLSEGAGNTGEVIHSTTAQYAGLYSAQLHVVTDGDPDEGAIAAMEFTSNSSLGTYMFDSLRVMVKFVQSSGDAPLGWYTFEQWNDSGMLSSISGDVDLCSWTDMVLMPIWGTGTTYWIFGMHLSADELVATNSSMYLDYFRFDSAQVDIRVRYWNLYTGLGYYTEKLLARYYTLEDGWIDIWQGEFQAYKGDEVLLSVTDVFGRNVWTGMVAIDSDPVYVDIMVPIVTVHILEPDWYNETVPMEWRITCLPWGADGPTGMTLPAIGFEFEVLAGWYNLAWLANGVVEAGNQTLLVEGDASIAKSFMLTDLSIPIDPDYQVAIEGGDGTIYDLKSWGGFIDTLVALGADKRFQAISVILVGLSIMTYAYQAKKLAKEAQRAQDANSRRPSK